MRHTRTFLLACFVANFAMADDAMPKMAHGDAYLSLKRLGAKVVTDSSGSHAVVEARRWLGTDKELGHISHLANLATVRIEGAGATAPNVICIANARTPTEFLIYDCSANDDSMNFLVRACPNLTKIALTGGRLQGHALAIIDRVPNLTHLDLANNPIKADFLSNIAILRKLEYLDISGAEITPAALRRIALCPELRTLVLNGTNVTDDMLPELRRLPNLQSLSIARTQITNTGLAMLGRLGLTELNVAENAFDDSALWRIATMSTLEQLNVSGVPITDDGLAILKGSRLKGLNLTNTKVEGPGLAHLAVVDSLNTLTLSKLDAQAAPHLRRIRSLKSLILEDIEMNALVVQDMPTLLELKVTGNCGCLRVAENANLLNVEVANCVIDDLFLLDLPKLNNAVLPGHLDQPSPLMRPLMKGPLPKMKSLTIARTGQMYLRLAAELEALEVKEMANLAFLDLGISKIGALNLDTRQVGSLWLGEHAFPDEDREFFRRFPLLHTLHLHGPRMDDGVMSQVALSESLRSLHVHKGKVTEHGFRYLRWINTIAAIEADGEPFDMTKLAH